jgi:rhodanese-related sulfurtransferase
MIDSLSDEKPELSDVLTRLHHPAVFMNLPLANVKQALMKMEKITLPAGTEIIKQGDQPDNFYIMLEGEAEVWRQDMYDTEQLHVATLREGNHFGEDAFLIEGTRNATVRVSTDATLLSLPGSDFKELISQPMVKSTDASNAKILLDQDDTVLIDVRYEEEWDEMRIPDATLIPLPDLRDRINELDKEKEYIVYCHAGKRSAVAAMIMEQAGLEACWLIDGIRDWPYDIISEGDQAFMH